MYISHVSLSILACFHELGPVNLWILPPPFHHAPSAIVCPSQQAQRRRLSQWCTCTCSTWASPSQALGPPFPFCPPTIPPSETDRNHPRCPRVCPPRCYNAMIYYPTTSYINGAATSLFLSAQEVLQAWVNTGHTGRHQCILCTGDENGFREPKDELKEPEAKVGKTTSLHQHPLCQSCFHF